MAAPKEREVNVSMVVPVAYSRVADELRLRPGYLLELAFPVASRRGESEVRAELHLRRFRASGRSFKLPAVLEFETPGTGDGTVIELRWRARYLPRAFPKMHASIRLHAVGQDSTELAFRGTYRPPLGLLGAVADRVVGLAAATATATRFVEDLAGSIRAGVR